MKKNWGELCMEIWKIISISLYIIYMFIYTYVRPKILNEFYNQMKTLYSKKRTILHYSTQENILVFRDRIKIKEN